MLRFSLRVLNPTRRGSKLFGFISRPSHTRTIMLPTPWTPNQYPKARRSDHVDVYESKQHGQVSVTDPYQWLEENSKETDAWTTEQDAFTRAYLDRNPDRAKLEKEIRTNTDYEKVQLAFVTLLDIVLY